MSKPRLILTFAFWFLITYIVVLLGLHVVLAILAGEMAPVSIVAAVIAIQLICITAGIKVARARIDHLTPDTRGFPVVVDSDRSGPAV